MTKTRIVLISLTLLWFYSTAYAQEETFEDTTDEKKSEELTSEIETAELNSKPADSTSVATGDAVELDRVIVLVAEGLITRRELEQRMEETVRMLKSKQVQLPSMASLQDQVLESLISEEIQAQGAKKLGIRIDDITLDREMSTLAKANGMSLLDFRGQITAEGLDYAAFRESIRQELAIKSLRKRQVDNQIKVSDQEVDDLIASQSDFLNKDMEIRLRQILISTPEDATPEQLREGRGKAEAIHKRLLEGEDFAKLAISESDGRRALEGGDLGWRPGAELPTIFTRSATLLEIGEISEVLRSPSGYHIVKIEDKRGGREAWIEQTRARHILIKTNALVNDDEARARLESLRRRIEGGDDFATLAKAYSEDQGSAKEGGDLGWATPGSFVPVFEETMNSLEIGQLSEPFQTEFGWHFMEVLERRRQNSTMKVLKSRAKQLIWEKKREDELSLWLRRLRDESYVEFVDERYKPAEDS
jgi:peptidyl-prolyl cis-trans isomerase SurA